MKKMYLGIIALVAMCAVVAIPALADDTTVDPIVGSWSGSVDFNYVVDIKMVQVIFKEDGTGDVILYEIDGDDYKKYISLPIDKWERVGENKYHAEGILKGDGEFIDESTLLVTLGDFDPVKLEKD